MLETKILSYLPFFCTLIYLFLFGLVKVKIAKNLNIKWFKMFIPVYCEYTMFKAVNMRGIYALFPLLVYLSFIPFINKLKYGVQFVTYAVIIINAILIYRRNMKMFKKIYSFKFNYMFLSYSYSQAPVISYFISYILYDGKREKKNKNKQNKITNQINLEIEEEQSFEIQKLTETEILEKVKKIDIVNKLEEKDKTLLYYFEKQNNKKEDHRKVKIYIKKDNKKEAKKLRRAKNKKNKSSNFTKLTALFLAFSIGITTLFAQNVKAIDFNEPDPNCKHEHVYKTFNQAYPCELGNIIDDDYFTVCEDCNGVLSSEKNIHKSIHGKVTEEKDGINICSACGKPANEDVRYVKRDVRIEEIQAIETEHYEKVKQEERNQQNIEIINDNRKVLEGRTLDKLEVSNDYYSYVTLLGDKNIKYLEGIEHLGENAKCKDGCKTIIASVSQPRNIQEDSIITMYYVCPNCISNKTVQITGSEYLDSANRARLESNSVELKAFWSAIDARENKNVSKPSNNRTENKIEKPKQNSVVKPEKKPVINPISKSDFNSLPEPPKYANFIKVVDALEELWYNQGRFESSFYTTAEIVLTMIAPEIGIAIDLVDSIVAGIIEAGHAAKAGESLGNIILAGIKKAVGRFAFITITSKFLECINRDTLNTLKQIKNSKTIKEIIERKINKVIKPYKYFPEKSITQLPKNVQDSYNEYVNVNWEREARQKQLKKQRKKIKTGKDFDNNALQLPEYDSKGNLIKYQEHDVNAVNFGENRKNEAERFITGSDGSVYYTMDHYKNYVKIK